MSNPTLNDAWNDYAERSGLTIDGVACSLAKAQSAYFAFEAGWNRRAQPEGLKIAHAELSEKLGRAAAENLSLNMENRHLREQLAERAQPEVEAPQADDEAEEHRREQEYFDRWPDAPAATLSPLCGAQHAESGKEVGNSVADFDAWMAKRGPLGAGGHPSRAFIAGHAYGVRAAQQAAAPAEDRKGIELWRAALRACGELPEGYEVRIELENGCGMAAWYDDEGERHVIDGDGYLSSDVNEAVDAAIQRAAQLDGGQEGSDHA